MQATGIEQMNTDHDAEELKGFSRSMAELQWLLLILVMLYFFIPIREIANTDALLVTMVSYAVFVLVFRYLNFQARETRFKLAVETWTMIGFITTVLWNTGYIESPLLNLYLLVIIACAITLGKVMTLLEVGLITCCYLMMGFKVHSLDIFMPETFTLLMARFSPFLLVAYVTSMLASDILSAKRKIARLSQTDDLTGVLNMRAFNTLYDKEVARIDRYGTPLTVIMVDVDGLKAINDRHGHAAGNRLIQTVSTVLNACVRSSDVLARYGGDEFVILLSQGDRHGAHATAERIRTAIANTSFDLNGEHITTTASIGIASFPHGVLDVRDVVDKADVALYRSKQTGRNRATYYHRSLDPVSAVAQSPVTLSAQRSA
ncbi:MAG: GGDEF domain-containing protein [Gammaproteobacteria bacterium]